MINIDFNPRACIGSHKKEYLNLHSQLVNETDKMLFSENSQLGRFIDVLNIIFISFTHYDKDKKNAHVCRKAHWNHFVAGHSSQDTNKNIVSKNYMQYNKQQF